MILASIEWVKGKNISPKIGKIGRNEKFIMQMAYGDKNVFNKVFWLIIEILAYMNFGLYYCQNKRFC